ncbi:MAG: glutathionylspermidine synthase family protein [Rhodospirillales bacterium]
MQRIAVTPRDGWRQTAAEHGFRFHTIDDAPYWDESACYRFTLDEIETALEAPVEDLEEMCFAVVERAAGDEAILRRLAIPEAFWDAVATSWRRRDRNLYGRIDFSFDGHGPAKLLEYNADTPTALYETAIFQWTWLEQAMAQGLIPPGCDQFNSVHERLVDALARFGITGTLHLACARGSDEDRGTVDYLEDCARQAGLETRFVFVEDIGIDGAGRFTDLEDQVIETLFKLYPWEWMMAEAFGRHVPASGVRFIEPIWKAVLANKGLLALLWEMFEGHPNLLPAYFADDPRVAALGSSYVRKPLLSREGGNVEIVRDGAAALATPGPYGAEGFVVQALHPLPEFDGNHPMVGCWLVASRAAGLCVREDRSPITSDAARFVPHVILE